MKDTRILMGMPITVEIVDKNASLNDLNEIYNYFEWVDQKFSTYKSTSEITKINERKIEKENYSGEMKEVLDKCEEWKQKTNGYFDIKKNGKLDPSGLVKGWAIYNAANILRKKGFKNFYIDAGGDIEVSGLNSEEKKWKVGIRNPFNRYQNVKILKVTNMGIATSGTAIRGQHIYNPKNLNQKLTEVVSLTVIGPNVYIADCYATAAFAMQQNGINFIQKVGLEGYQINKDGVATFTEGFSKFIA